MSPQRRGTGEWTGSNLPNQTGRTAVVTGSSSGVGFHAARIMAELGAEVVVACRDLQKGQAAIDRITAAAPKASAQLLHLDLTSLASVRTAAAQLHSMADRVDVLINNAGVMWAPYELTLDGFEMHLGTNHFGHFAFTGLVLDMLLAIDGSRVVVVSSPSHRQGTFDFDDLHWSKDYKKGAAYARSKLANLLFTYELQTRLSQANAPTIALSAHPGAARTALNRHMPLPFRGASWGLTRPMTHSAAKGVLSLVRAALDPAVAGGEYYAPSSKREFKGYPERRESSELSHDRELQQRLWQVSEELTGVTYQLAVPTAPESP